MAARHLRVAGLFAGIGGLELGLACAGHHTELLCEIEPGAVEVLRTRFPDVPVHQDVRTLARFPKSVDLVVGGFPCQDLSQAGLTKGMKGDQSSLVDEVFRLLRVSDVPWVVLENVPFMLQLGRGNAIRHVTAQLERLGYQWAYRVIDTRPGILPLPDGSGRETGSASGANKKIKKTDVRYATANTGLELLVSIKTLNFRDTKKDSSGNVVIRRYTKNMVRNDHELRAEAMDHHDRFPYAVLIGVFFIPIDACDDGDNDKSSFAHAVVTFRPRAGRADTSDPPAKFERLFIGLYDAADSSGHGVGFFDVQTAPPRRGRPPWPTEEPDPSRGLRLLTIDQVVEEIVREFGIRNQTYIRWADESLTTARDRSLKGGAAGSKATS